MSKASGLVCEVVVLLESLLFWFGVFVFSAANSDVYVNSRTLYNMARDGNAPKIFLRTNKRGTPWVAMSVSITFSCIAFTNVSADAFKSEAL